MKLREIRAMLRFGKRYASERFILSRTDGALKSHCHLTKVRFYINVKTAFINNYYEGEFNGQDRIMPFTI